MGQLGQLARSMLVRQLARLLVWRLARLLLRQLARSGLTRQLAR
jgi:hypothetical protein